MGDINDDSKVHYIVKDYKRMYEGFHALVDENKSLRKKVEELQEKVNHLHSKLGKEEQAAKKKADGEVRGTLHDSLCQANALHSKAKQFMEQAEKLTKTLEKFDRKIRK